MFRLLLMTIKDFVTKYPPTSLISSCSSFSVIYAHISCSACSPTDGSFCLICLPYPFYPSHLSALWFSKESPETTWITIRWKAYLKPRFLGHIWDTLHVIFWKSSVELYFLTNQIKNVRATDLPSEFLLWRISSTMTHLGPSVLLLLPTFS